MPLVSALAASHAPNILLEPGREWEDFMDLHYSMAPQGSVNRPTLEQQKKLRQDAETAFATLRADLEQAKPDVLIVVANDQFVNFFWNNIPTFFVTVAEPSRGSSPVISSIIKITRSWARRSFAPAWSRASTFPSVSMSSCSIRKMCRFIFSCRNRRFPSYRSTSTPGSIRRHRHGAAIRSAS